jgi:hypothetical protein
MDAYGVGSGRQIFGHAFVTNEQGHPLMVTRPTGELELPGGLTALEESAVGPAAYHLRRLGLAKQPGPILLVDHTEALFLGAAGDRFTFIFYGGKLTPTEIASICAHGHPDDVTAWRFVDPRFYEAGITRYHRRCLDVAVTAAATGAGAPYLRNALRITAAAVPV